MRTNALGCCLLAACASATGAENGGPRGLRADDHLAIANREATRADELGRWPDARGDLTDPMGRNGVWLGTWDTAEDHRRLALSHRSAAAELEAAYEQACGT